MLKYTAKQYLVVSNISMQITQNTDIVTGTFTQLFEAFVSALLSY